MKKALCAFFNFKLLYLAYLENPATLVGTAHVIPFQHTGVIAVS
jgi:hypothetical protein